MLRYIRKACVAMSSTTSPEALVINNRSSWLDSLPLQNFVVHQWFTTSLHLIALPNLVLSNSWIEQVRYSWKFSLLWVHTLLLFSTIKLRCIYQSQSAPPVLGFVSLLSNYAEVELFLLCSGQTLLGHVTWVGFFLHEPVQPATAEDSSIS